jgi:SAM-dependent methyltransferase
MTSGPGYDKASGFKAAKFDDRIPRCLRIIRRLAPPRMLDVGCGDGFFMDLATRAGAGRLHMAGIELNARAAEMARAKGFDTRAGNVESAMPFPDGSFDLVFAGEIIEHVTDPDAMLREIHRVLSPSGNLLLTTPNLLAWFNRALVLAGVTPLFVEHSYRATYGPAYSLLHRVGKPVGHLRIFNWTPLRRVLEDNGFRIRLRWASACLPVPVVHQVDRLVARVYPRLGANFVVLAQRF